MFFPFRYFRRNETEYWVLHYRVIQTATPDTILLTNSYVSIFQRSNLFDNNCSFFFKFLFDVLSFWMEWCGQFKYKDLHRIFILTINASRLGNRNLFCGCSVHHPASLIVFNLIPMWFRKLACWCSPNSALAKACTDTTGKILQCTVLSKLSSKNSFSVYSMIKNRWRIM